MQTPLYRIVLLPIVAVMLLAGCATQAPPVVRAPPPTTDLLSGAEFGLKPDSRVPYTELTAVDREMKAFLREHVSPNLGSRQKVERILAAILDEGLKLDYNNFKTFTATEAFYAREGNCMSFTNLFVALAREAGVRASYQEVEVPPTWMARGETWMYNLHINAVVDLPGSEQIVDFNLESYDKTYHRRVLSDEAAESRYHNNMGVHWMGEGDFPQSFLHFKEAITLRPKTGHIWSNLGTLYRRGGHQQQAEQAYLRSIELSNEPAAMSNLARLYKQQGRLALADEYESKVQIHRKKNPYYLYHLAEQAYEKEQYNEAKTLLRSAIRYRDTEHEFYRLLGLTHAQLGEVSAAEKRFRQAVDLAADAEKERYNHKLRLLAEH